MLAESTRKFSIPIIIPVPYGNTVFMSLRERERLNEPGEHISP